MCAAAVTNTVTAAIHYKTMQSLLLPRVQPIWIWQVARSLFLSIFIVLFLYVHSKYFLLF